MTVTDEMIAAYADGELAGDALAEVEAAIAADPALARKVEAHRALRAQLGAHFAPVLDQQVPDRLSALLGGAAEAEPDAEVISFAKEREKRGLIPSVRRWGIYVGPAMAAAVVAAVVLLPGDGGPNPIPSDGIAGPQLAAALDNQLAGEQAETTILLSFEQSSGSYCRVYRSENAGGIACREGEGWQIEQEMWLGEGQSTEFRQAGSEGDLLAAAQDMAVGGALDAAGEAAARDNGWR